MNVKIAETLYMCLILTWLNIPFEHNENSILHKMAIYNFYRINSVVAKDIVLCEHYTIPLVVVNKTYFLRSGTSLSEFSNELAVRVEGDDEWAMFDFSKFVTTLSEIPELKLKLKYIFIFLVIIWY